MSFLNIVTLLLLTSTGSALAKRTTFEIWEWNLPGSRVATPVHTAVRVFDRWYEYGTSVVDVKNKGGNKYATEPLVNQINAVMSGKPKLVCRVEIDASPSDFDAFINRIKPNFKREDYCAYGGYVVTGCGWPHNCHTFTKEIRDYFDVSAYTCFVHQFHFGS